MRDYLGDCVSDQVDVGDRREGGLGLRFVPWAPGLVLAPQVRTRWFSKSKNECRGRSEFEVSGRLQGRGLGALNNAADSTAE